MVLKFFKLSLWICTAPLLFLFFISWMILFGGLALLLLAIAIGFYVSGFLSIVGFFIFFPIGHLILEFLNCFDSEFFVPEWAFCWWQERYNDILYYNPANFLY